MSKIIINTRKVYETGNYYDSLAKRVYDNKEKLKDIADTIKTVWTGSDSISFTNSFEEHIKGIDEIISFLEKESSLLKRVSTSHGEKDNNFNNKMKRCDISDEYRYR